MTEATRESIKSAGVQAVVGLMAFGAMWFLTVREDLSLMQHRVEQLETTHESDDERAERMTRLELGICLIGSHLQVSGFDKVCR